MQVEDSILFLKFLLFASVKLCSKQKIFIYSCSKVSRTYEHKWDLKPHEISGVWQISEIKRSVEYKHDSIL